MATFVQKSCYACLPKTERGKAIVLGGDPKKKNFLYTYGKSVIIRNISDPTECDLYTEHSYPVIVAKYSPSGFYIASGDTSGKVRIWDTTQKEHILKVEHQPLSGAIKDLAWSGDSTRIVVVGEGRECYAKVFSWDGGNTLGDVQRHSNRVNSCDFRLERPFKIITGSDDFLVNFFEGPPFKYKCCIEDHSNFVNVVRFSPKGDHFLTGGSDGRVFLFDGKTAEKIGEFGPPAHKGGIYGACFSPDSASVLTVSGDKTAKIWTVSSLSLQREWLLGSTIADMQVGCLWEADSLLSVSLSGFINYLDVNGSDNSVARIVKGHNHPITSVCASSDGRYLFTGDSNARICRWNVISGDCEIFQGKPHGSQVNALCLVVDDELLSCSVDDTYRRNTVLTTQYSDLSVQLPSQPKSLCVVPTNLSMTIIASINHVLLVSGLNVIYSLPVSYEPCSVSFHPSDNVFAVAGFQDSTVHLYRLEADSFVDFTTIKLSGQCTCVTFSPDGSYLATADTNRRVSVFKEYKKVHEFVGHNSRVNAVSWSPDSTHIASGSLDSSVAIWNLGHPDKKTIINRAHPLSQINGLVWLNNTEFASVGQDACIKFWTSK